MADQDQQGETAFVAEPVLGEEVRQLYAEDVEDLGYVMNVTRVWAHQPDVQAGLFELLGRICHAHGLDLRTRGILVAACASAAGDSYCSLAWGSKLAQFSDADTAAGVLRGTDDGLTPAERALAGWARKVARNPNGTTAADVQALRDAGFDDPLIVAVTTFVALRLAFSAVNDALGVLPDAQLDATAPAEVLTAVTWGRPIAGAAGTSPT